MLSVDQQSYDLQRQQQEMPSEVQIEQPPMTQPKQVLKTSKITPLRVVLALTVLAIIGLTYYQVNVAVRVVPQKSKLQLASDNIIKHNSDTNSNSGKSSTGTTSTTGSTTRKVDKPMKANGPSGKTVIGGGLGGDGDDNGDQQSDKNQKETGEKRKKLVEKNKLAGTKNQSTTEEQQSVTEESQEFQNKQMNWSSNSPPPDSYTTGNARQ